MPQQGFFQSINKYALSAVALAFGLFHLASISGLFSISTMSMRLIHLSFALSLLFAIKPVSKKLAGSRLNTSISTVLIVCTLLSGYWMLTRWKPIAFSGGLVESTDFYAGIVILALVFEAARRGVGLVLALITMLFFIYPFVSSYLPGVLNSRGYGFERIVTALTTNTQGVYGIPVGVAATYIIVFTIFGALLSGFGAGDFFFKISMRFTRGLRAASAKSAVIFSTLIGMVSGSAAGNVAVTGTVTIPIMKREGYQPHQAGAIEAVASTGGQLMPPVMGAAAFIMAEIVGVPYTEVMTTALLPAILFFVAIFAMVHLQAVKSGIEPKTTPLTEEDNRPLYVLLLEGLPFIATFMTLIGLMLVGYSPFKASMWAMLVLLGLDILKRRRIDREFFAKLSKGISEGATSVVTISAACAAAGIISGILGMTGLGSKIALLIDIASNGYLPLALLFTMFTSIILGMGLPTTAAYLILATVIAPALVDMGVPVLTAHFFVFYFGCISTITPPVALAAYVAGGIAGADINKVGWTAAAYGLNCFILPFAFCYSSDLLLSGTVVGGGMALVTGIIGILCISVAVIGHLYQPLSVWVCGGFFVAGILFLFQGLMTAFIGLLILSLLIIFEKTKQKRNLKESF
ncbi:TRAP transporter fused permease subunit [Marinomonas sp.]|nr:TRAP transporter fused permease subunit [Marinomonas sp.]MDB4837295.1 TRAP transporter fused permease subunit [Marinomonas sp.]